MGCYFFKIFFAMSLCIFHGQLSILGFNSPSQVKCIHTERQALLKFKQGLIDDHGMLSTWSNHDCCKWKGIQCNNQTGHVQMLHLRGHYPRYLKGAVDLTSLIALQNIQHLDLSFNDFGGSHIPRLIGSFTNLRYLNLSSSNFYGSIPYELGNLSQLRYLDLQGNALNGEIPYQLGNLSQLRFLDLQWNSLHGTIPSQLGKLKSLRCLRLYGGDGLEINDAKWLTSLSSLTTLDLTDFPNLGSSRESIQIISELIPNLRDLRLTDSQLSDDNISSLFHSQFNLSILDLSGNKLTSSTFQLLSKYGHNLQILYFSNNNLSSSIFQENFNFSYKLRELYLAECGLTDKNFLVPSASIKSSSSSLVTLDLSSNLLKSSATFHWLLNFTTNLHSLKILGNLLEGPIPDGFGKIMSSLEVLDLSYNKLQGEIPASLGNTCTLQELYLTNNNLSGEISIFIPNSSWCNRHAFRILDISSNRMTGVLPNLSIFTSLWRLDLSNNQLTGEIPKSIGLLHELVYLYLGENYLEGNINDLHLSNLTKLMALDLTDNSLSLKFGATWVPPFQLHSLELASCKLGPSFPRWLQNQRHLWLLDISNAGIDDFVPEWFWNKLQSISRMNMSYNSLRGTIPNLPINFADEFPIIVLNSNQFEGGIPVFLSQALILDLSNNKISNLNKFLCGKGSTTNIGTLDLSNNLITGQLPDCWDHLKNSLEFLDLSNNKLSGRIPQSMGTLVNLEALVLRNNSLIGELPFTLKNCTELLILDLSYNLLSGPIPSWIGESLHQLKILSLRVNHFFGSIPIHLCYLRHIHLLDLSRNSLLGGIPTCLSNFSAMTEREVMTGVIRRERKMTHAGTDLTSYDSNVLLTWKSQDYEFWNGEFLLKSIDLSSNDLTGELPKEIRYLHGLVSLNLSRNNLNGEIPSEIGNLNWLEFLDLSRNHLSGRIPSTLSKIDGLGMLDLSNNDLSGRIPWEGHLETFDASSFEENVGLCGKQINKDCPGDETTVQHQGKAVDGEDDNSVFYEGLYMSLGFGYFIGFWSLLGSILVCQRWRISYMRLLNTLSDYILLTVEVNVSKCHRWFKDQQHKICSLWH